MAKTKDKIDMFAYEKEFMAKGYKLISGTDEVGRGPLAGPVCVASVIMPLDEEHIIEGINDSKKLSEKKREELYEKILQTAKYVKVSYVSEKEIDDINILQATKKAMADSLCFPDVMPDIALVDAVKNLDAPCEQIPIIKGDAKSYSIAAASIVAKVERDRLMKKMAEKYPEYGFEQNKGYGTAKHIEALKKFGPCEIHRKTFLKFLGEENNNV